MQLKSYHKLLTIIATPASDKIKEKKTHEDFIISSTDLN